MKAGLASRNIVLNISRWVSLAVVLDFSSFLLFKVGWLDFLWDPTFTQAGSSFNKSKRRESWRHWTIRNSQRRHTENTPLGSRMKWRMESTSSLVPSKTLSSQVNSAFRELWLVKSEVISKYYSPPSNRCDRFLNFWPLVTHKITFWSANYSACVVYTKTVIHLSVGKSDEYLPCRFVARYMSITIHLHFGDKLLIFFSQATERTGILIPQIWLANHTTWPVKLLTIRPTGRIFSSLPKFRS